MASVFSCSPASTQRHTRLSPEVNHIIFSPFILISFLPNTLGALFFATCRLRSTRKLVSALRLGAWLGNLRTEPPVLLIKVMEGGGEAIVRIVDVSLLTDRKGCGHFGHALP